jgi:aminoglycoside 6'-N-acetyltransferase I
MTDDKTALALLDDRGQPIAWIAAGRDWGEIWELHPLIVALDQQGHGHGRRLVREVERIAAEAGARTMTLSTSDAVGATSLANADLYADVPGELARFAVHRPHAAAFWLRVGYTVVGVTPDAEGPGQPSIAFARRLCPVLERSVVESRVDGL